MNYLLNEAKKVFKYVIKENDNVVLSNNPIRGEDDFVCNNEGTFTKERGVIIQIADFDSTEKNILGLLCVLMDKEKVSRDDSDKIRKAESNQDIQEVFNKYIPNEYVRDNLHFVVDDFKNESINVVRENNVYRFYNVLNEKAINLAVSSDNKNSVYDRALQTLVLKKQFDEKILRNLSSEEYSIDEILRLSSLFIRKNKSVVKDISMVGKHK